MALTAGARLGPYEIRDRLGAGGMGEVCRAWDDCLAREVAVKVLKAPFASDPDRARRFEQEARTAGGLSHGAGSEDLTASPLTQAGAIVGTVAYMSPEQVRGAAVDARSTSPRAGGSPASRRDRLATGASLPGVP